MPSKPKRIFLAGEETLFDEPFKRRPNQSVHGKARFLLKLAWRNPLQPPEGEDEPFAGAIFGG